MCNLAWTVVADRIRSRHMGTEDGPQAAVDEFADLLDAPPPPRPKSQAEAVLAQLDNL